MTPAKSTALLQLAAAGVVGAAILGGSWLIDRSLDRITDKMKALENGIEETQGSIDALGEAVQKAAGRRPPDPDRVYDIRTAGAPVRGTPGARVRIAEFSDFQ